MAAVLEPKVQNHTIEFRRNFEVVWGREIVTVLISGNALQALMVGGTISSSTGLRLKKISVEF